MKHRDTDAAVALLIIIGMIFAYFIISDMDVRRALCPCECETEIIK